MAKRTQREVAAELVDDIEPQRLARIAEALPAWPLVVCVDDAAQATRTDARFLWTTFTRFEPAADIFAMPSLWEGLPVAVLEAMFAANPVIATTVSGIPELVQSGTTGLLVAPADAGALAGAMEPKMRAMGRSRVMA